MNAQATINPNKTARIAGVLYLVPWVFSFLANKGLEVPIIILGAEEKVKSKIPNEDGNIHFVSLPINQEKLETALQCVGAGYALNHVS